MTMNQVTAGAGADTVVNENFRGVAPAALYGIKSISGLNLSLYGGAFNTVDVSDQTVTLTASNTNYVVANRATGTVTSATTTTNWNDQITYLRLYQIVAGTSTLTIAATSDKRQAMGDWVGLLANPMTTAEDIVKGGASGTPARLGVGADGQVLSVVSGTVAWANSAAGFSNPMTTAGDLIVGGASGAATRLAKGTAFQGLRMNSAATAAEWASQIVCIPIACSDETTALTAGAAKVTFRMPFAMKLTAVRASLTTAQASGASLVTVDVNESGASILSTKLTFDNTEKTTTTAATAPVISDADLADDAEITVDIDLLQAGSVAAGLKVYLIGYVAQ